VGSLWFTGQAGHPANQVSNNPEEPIQEAKIAIRPKKRYKMAHG